MKKGRPQANPEKRMRQLVITVTPEHHGFVKKNGLRVSWMVRKMLNDMIADQKMVDAFRAKDIQDEPNKTLHAFYKAVDTGNIEKMEELEMKILLEFPSFHPPMVRYKEMKEKHPLKYKHLQRMVKK